MGSVDDLTFKVNFSSDGAAKLRERVRDKLKEFMGDYTDDTLVEYVIVLLRNGRRKEQARNELNVFLGDDSDYFISWLWDHLASNLDMYICPPESHAKDAAKSKSTQGNIVEIDDPKQRDSESVREKSVKLARTRHNREWKGLARDAEEPPPLRSAVVDDTNTRGKSHRKVSRKRSLSPIPRKHKRSREDDHQNLTREAVSKATVNAPRRLLQFAVRDAVENSRPKEPSSKRLRSVVATSSEKTLLAGHPQRIHSVACVPNPMSTVIKAVAEAAEDVIKVRSARSVFDRISCGTNASESAEQPVDFRDYAAMDEEYGHRNQCIENTQSRHLQRSEYKFQVRNIEALETETCLASDSMSDNEGSDDFNVISNGARNAFQAGTSAGKNGDDSLMLQYSVAKGDQVMRVSRNEHKEQSPVGAHPSQKIVNISVNVNTWKPSHYQEVREASGFDSQKSTETEAVASKSVIQSRKENSSSVTVNGNAKPANNIQKGFSNAQQPTPGSQGVAHHSEGADSRTIFVNNVHFAATKDRLSRHFNKFGEVLKVVILTDAATGKPKGSAYIEFMHKEAANNALSLDGTSFMSRILKVVKRQAAPPDATPVTPFPRIARGSVYASARFARAPFPRGMAAAFRPLPIKPGARSLQWKRDAQSSPAKIGASVLTNSGFSSARSLTYVRTEPKTGGNANTTT